MGAGLGARTNRERASLGPAGRSVGFGGAREFGEAGGRAPTCHAEADLDGFFAEARAQSRAGGLSDGLLSRVMADALALQPRAGAAAAEALPGAEVSATGRKAAIAELWGARLPRQLRGRPVAEVPSPPPGPVPGRAGGPVRPVPVPVSARAPSARPASAGGVWAMLTAGFGGSGVLAGLGAVALLGVFIGYADPSGVAAQFLDLSGEGLEGGLELLPAAEIFLSEG
ncbi:hypothetical protein [Pseudogemmobacter sonorensis]|uniref:hypothetical protein n=1 Tax=Pseudogemmobacter sonorensis TaxID=2989681 RepID=UPI0036C37086